MAGSIAGRACGCRCRRPLKCVAQPARRMAARPAAAPALPESQDRNLAPEAGHLARPWHRERAAVRRCHRPAASATQERGGGICTSCGTRRCRALAARGSRISPAASRDGVRGLLFRAGAARQTCTLECSDLLRCKSGSLSRFAVVVESSHILSVTRPP
jgi:hypothetical protein